MLKKETAAKTSKTVKKVEKTKVIEKLVKKLLDELGLTADLSVEKTPDQDISVRLTTENPGLIIGFHGETLSALQLILGMMAYRQTGEWTRILVNVNDYRERRQENLEMIALSAASRAKETGQPQALSPMNSSERRIVHLILSEDSEITTESEGEDWQRHVVIRPVETESNK